MDDLFDLVCVGKYVVAAEHLVVDWLGFLDMFKVTDNLCDNEA